ncbi:MULTISPECIES: hypothetical protein [Rhizobium/Agrobacterium group]|jgi:hypothetical protein|uniref:Uncharacterized protein n=1 Tax=Agrobacterium cucumeris TaxID=2862866 RepID=A0ABY8RXE4_9HYPH|nr:MULTISPECIES: hypothetical protein [Rhizobium/Agrobacterium group]MCZ7472444.1 hypothetical protein [Rhizobium rhizogenes]MCZ7483755.1 hypothetical protein [Rhizobium rhizogenes]MEB3046235.1 hypothetical protein [Rhizobium sp. MJ21]WHO11793.1 hypothetical protein KZ699_24310 [Agrobacterium cucumeris]
MNGWIIDVRQPDREDGRWRLLEGVHTVRVELRAGTAKDMCDGALDGLGLLVGVSRGQRVEIVGDGDNAS